MTPEADSYVSRLIAHTSIVSKELFDKYPQKRGMYYIRENVSKQDFVIHVINNSGSWYRELGCLEGFNKRIMHRWHYLHTRKNRVEGIHCNYQRLDQGSMASCMGLDGTYTQVIHTSAYKFFKYIGFDYKNKSVKQLDKFIQKRTGNV